jgi:hypothetical protein
MSGKKKKKGASTVNHKEERLSDERKKVPLDEMKKGVRPYRKRGGPTLPLSPPQIKLQGHLCRQPTVPRGITSSLEELDLRIRKWRTQALHEVNNRAKLRSHRITVCRGAIERRMTFVIRSGSIHQLKHYPNNKIRVYQYQF